MLFRSDNVFDVIASRCNVPVMRAFIGDRVWGKPPIWLRILRRISSRRCSACASGEIGDSCCAAFERGFGKCGEIAIEHVLSMCRCDGGGENDAKH